MKKPELGDQPQIKAATPAAQAGKEPRMIAIPGGKPSPRRSAGTHDPNAYWNDYFKRLDEQPALVLETLIFLREEKKDAEVEACLRAYLTQRNNRALPWMYEMLAVAVEARKGTRDEVKTLLGYAAVLAIKSKNPNDLLSVADFLHRRGIYEQVGYQKNLTTAGELIDHAIEKIPHRVEPFLMSILVASKTKDAARMGSTAEKVLSLGWPGNDEQTRREVRNQVDALAKILREDGKEKEADELLARMPLALSRDLYIRLSWDGLDDIDLLVDEPHGTTAQLFKTPRTILGGAIVTNGFGKHPQEIYVCPRAFSGKYTVRVDKVFQPDTNPVTTANLEVITHEGTDKEKRETFKIDLSKPEPIVINLEAGRRTETLPLFAQPVDQPKEAKSKAFAKPASKPAK
jgi:hypothetical protein